MTFGLPRFYAFSQVKTMSVEVFVSYSSQDRDRVIPVVEYLRNSGISVWVDEGNIHAADLWSEQIVQAIAGCRVMVVMLSGNSTDSHNVVKEAMLASEQKKALLPVYLEPADIPAKLQYQLAGIQHLELYGENEQQVLEDLANGLAKRGVSRDGKPAAPLPTTVKRHEGPRPKPATPIQPKNLAKPIAWALAVCVVVLLGLMFFKSPPSQSGQNSDSDSKVNTGRMHFQIPVPAEYPLAKPTDMPFGVPMTLIVLSPSGDKLVYVCMFEDSRYLCLRKLDEQGVKLLKGTKDAVMPFFRPDGKWVGFFTEKKLKTLELESGLVKELCDAKNAYYGGCWGEDGAIYFGNSEGIDFVGIKETGGDTWVVTDQIEVLFNPRVAMNGDSLIFSSAGLGVFRGALSVYHIPLVQGGEPRQLSSGRFPTWFGDDTLVTVEDGQLVSTRMNVQAFQPDSEPKVVTPSKIMTQSIYSQYSLAKNNVLAFLEGYVAPELTLTMYDPPSQSATVVTEKAEEFGQFSVSPDGSKIAVEVVNNQIYDVQILDLKRNRFSSFSGAKPNFTPFWSPDGNKLYYASYRGDPKVAEIFVYDLLSNEEKKIELKGEPMIWFNISDVSADGKELLGFGKETVGLSELYLVDQENAKKTKLTSNNINEWGGTLSLDEKWIAYTSEKDMEGSYAIYINRFPEMNDEIRISSGGGEEPKWLPDGFGVYYRNGSQWMKVPLKLEGEMEIGEPELFFEGDYVNVFGPSHDVFPDGRILLLKGDKWVQPTEIDVIINAFDVGP